MRPLSRSFAALSLAVCMGAGAAPLNNNSIDVRTTTFDMSFADLTFAGAFNYRADQLTFRGTVGDSGTFGVNGLAPGSSISVIPGSGMNVTNLQPASASGVVFYTVSITGTTDLTITQSWITTRTINSGITSAGQYYIDFFGRNSGFLRAGGIFDYSISIPGDWSSSGASSGQVQFLGINSDFSVAKNFVFDATTGRTTLEAINSDYNPTAVGPDIHFVLYGQPVPEPTSAMMLSLGLAVLLFKRPRRRVQPTVASYRLGEAC